MAPATVKKLPKGFEKQIIELEYVLDRLGQASLTASQLVQAQSPTEIITKLVALYSVRHIAQRLKAGVEHYDGSGDMMLAELYRGKIQSLFTKPHVIQEYMMMSMTKAANCQQEQPAKKEKIEMRPTPLPPQTPPSSSTFGKIELIKVVKQSPPSQ